MRQSYLALFIAYLLLHVAQAQTKPIVERSFVEKMLYSLANDDMRGRHALSADADKAADVIAEAFTEIGLTPYTETGYRQTFTMTSITRKSQRITWNNSVLNPDSYIILSNAPKISWNNKSSIRTLNIDKGDNFAQRFREIALSEGDALVIIDPSFASYISRYAKIYDRQNVVNSQAIDQSSKVFVVSDKRPKKYEVTHENTVKDVNLSNVAGIIPGKTKPEEYVIFSGHYDHIGIIAAEGQDSIANGADDDASGITAMISLAKYYKNENANARTLIFVAFTAEEIGMFGSKYFSNHINPDQVTAMINIEMIGKDSKFGPNTLYITGYDRSNLGALMQENLKGSDFTFHADPYTKQNLFYRSDNAVLAALGVPAHTFSTSQIDKDIYYHTVKDEISTLDIGNIISSIEAIAIGAKGIVDGSQTPTRVEKLTP
ncbi:M20/M25/M40 family metallo-hydrolase [Sphingobacterium sp. Mn56C]|uniref:M20/M25/M40 family metallo-hydrolase n=1 Tax=Sphingobacterium sp. Mn56C TaxID=3395261 RepID=UPI003BCD2CE8